MNLDAGETPLTMHEKGVSGKPTAYDRLMASPQWKAAKAKVDPETRQEFADEERRQGAIFIADVLGSVNRSALKAILATASYSN